MPLPDDIARCVDGDECPRRDQCARWVYRDRIGLRAPLMLFAEIAWRRERECDAFIAMKRGE